MPKVPQPLNKSSPPKTKPIPKKVKLWFKIRYYPNDEWCDVWLLFRDGAVTSCCMHGYLMKERAEQLKKIMTNVPCEEETSPFTVKRDSLNRPLKHNLDLGY